MSEAPLVNQTNINGLWSSSKLGYESVWHVEVDPGGESLSMVEQSGKCCGFLPNCILKTHHMQREKGEIYGIQYSYKGRLGGKVVCLEITSNTSMRHLTTDGLMTMTRQLADHHEQDREPKVSPETETETEMQSARERQ